MFSYFLFSFCAGRGRDNSPRDPFVKIFLLPDERNCKVSKVRRKTLTPVYNESVTFQVNKLDRYAHITFKKKPTKLL